ncbi:hypothetical protein GQ43DRAFT_408650 [Delitschia confertaspora ATCC 74209]|uniref:Uncharacterized protein n=1 Tax=Delitschia confertaspora ATCC 74209 TaxID=1513339 RepID=A0A9P4MT40_9PLEO|nr:hypothetical protein GQ43DRAFT_408650 [Delitschia confertaspora ATCC 74209]
MKTTLITSLFLAATGINAAPSFAPRLTSIPISIYDSAGCNNGPSPASIANVPTDGSCFGIAAILTQNTSSGLIDTANLQALPAGCTVTLYSDSTCSSPNFVAVTKAGQCFTFGPGKFVSSARTSGTC